MSRIAYLSLLTVLGAIIVHITIIFMVPSFAQSNAWSHISALTPKYRFALLPKDEAIIRSTDPLFKLVACHFDLSDGPVQLKANDTTSFWSLSVFNREGDNLYSINNRTTPNNVLDLTLGDPVQIMELKETIDPSTDTSVMITQDIDEGFVILRALGGDTIDNRQSEKFLKTASCQLLDD